MAIERVASLLLILAFAQGIAGAARSELAWPALCARMAAGVEREPDEVRRYRMFLNDQPAGREVFRFWRDGGEVRVRVRTGLEGDVLMFPADFRHCRDERWREEAGVLQLIELEGATDYAAPFKADAKIRIERDAEGLVVYRIASTLGSSEDHYPANTGAISPWSIRTIDYDRMLDVFEHGAYRIESRLVGRAEVQGREVVHYAVTGQWPRHLWYQDGKMVRFCAEEVFGTYIETIWEPYLDLDTDAAELRRPCAEVFQ